MGHLKMTFTQTRFVHASSSHHQHYQHSKSALEYLSPNNIIGTRSPSCGDNTPVRLLPASDYVSTRRMDTDKLQSCRMPADRVEGYPGREFGRAVIENHALREIQPHDAADVFRLK